MGKLELIVRLVLFPLYLVNCVVIVASLLGVWTLVLWKLLGLLLLQSFCFDVIIVFSWAALGP